AVSSNLRALSAVLLIALSSVLGACTQASPTSGAAIPSGAPSAGSSESEWNKLVAAAKTEGKVVIAATNAQGYEQAMKEFETDYPGISVEYTPIAGRDFFPRLEREREAGQYLWDVRVGGSDVTTFDLKKQGGLDPVRPLLMLPEVTDDKAWLGGLSSLFQDNEGQYVVAFAAYSEARAYVNRDLASAADLESSSQLLDPRWKGKISLQDPRGGGGAAGLAMFLIDDGEQFVRDLLTKQNVVVTNDARQQAEWLARGTYPIGVGAATSFVHAFQQQGVGQNVKPLPSRLEWWTAGGGGLQVINKRPHPNATTVFVNWLLTKKTQTRLGQLGSQNSARADVPPAVPEFALDSAHLDKYVELYLEKYLPQRIASERLAQELLK
ncbi:MAG TPA: extracellular solute-binding protein, partial [Chloroflexota bacterium]|nr:extracellular solute-binding protein [Chloroflexota bacterium]